MARLGDGPGSKSDSRISRARLSEEVMKVGKRRLMAELAYEQRELPPMIRGVV